MGARRPGNRQQLRFADCHNTASPEFAKGKPELTLPVRMRLARWKPLVNLLRKPTFRPAIDGLRSVPCGVLLRRKNKAVKFPWDDGMKVENMERITTKLPSLTGLTPCRKRQCESAAPGI